MQYLVPLFNYDDMHLFCCVMFLLDSSIKSRSIELIKLKIQSIISDLKSGKFVVLYNWQRVYGSLFYSKCIAKLVSISLFFFICIYNQRNTNMFDGYKESCNVRLLISVYIYHHIG